MKKSVFTLALLLVVFSVFAQKEFKKFGIKAGFSVVQHLEAQIYGVNESTQQMDTFGGTLKGTDQMNGVDIKAYYFFENDLGIYTDIGFGYSENEVNYENASDFTIQEATTDFISISFGASAKVTPDKLPVNFIFSSGMGYYGYNMSYSTRVNEIGQWYDSNYQMLKFNIELLAEYMIYNDINIFTEINYSTQLWEGDDWHLETDDGDYYMISLNSPSMAAIRTTIGFGYNF